MKTFVSGKIHGIRVTGGSINYNGSVTISKELMEAAGIEPYEQLHISNLNNGARWITYALPSDVKGLFTLNGGAARLGVLGDVCIILTYEQRGSHSSAKVIFCNEKNEIRKTMVYGE